MEISSDLSYHDLLQTWHEQELQVLIASEHRLNICGYLLGVSIVSAIGRACIGAALVVQGIVEVAFNTANIFSFSWEKYHVSFLKSVQYINHGLANLVRAVIEGVCLGGGIALIAYDTRYRYTYLSESSTKKNFLTDLLSVLKRNTLHK